MSGMSKLNTSTNTILSLSLSAATNMCAAIQHSPHRTNELLKFQKSIYCFGLLRLCSDFNYKFHEILYIRTMSSRRDDI